VKAPAQDVAVAAVVTAPIDPFDDPSSLMKAIVESADDAIVSTHLDGTIASWNQGAVRLYGYTGSEAVGQNMAMLLSPDRSEELAFILARVRANSPVRQFDTQRVRKDGAYIDVSISASPIRSNRGLIVGAATIGRDVTALNDTRDEALAASELRTAAARAEVRAEEEVSLAKSEVVSLVSHELRSPLASIVGFTELLYTRKLAEAQRKVYLGVMLREGRRLTELVNDVLQMQSLEAGHQTLNFAPTDLRSLIQHAIEAAGEDDRRPIGMIMREPLPLVMADPDAILQVMSNLLSNARKFSPVGGDIRIGARVAGEMVRVHVRDEGLGIPPDALPRLFHKFYRVDSPDRRLIRGSGLGLSINRQIIHAHGGSIEAHSAGLGKGSRFEFTLPIARDTTTQGDVLIVEDDARFARVLGAEFSARNLTSVWASNAETAEKLVQASTPRAIVLDLKLPGMQGEAFLASLQAQGITGIPVAVVTHMSLEPEELRALSDMGVLAVLPKEAGAPQAAVTLIADWLAAEAPPT
jgi:PAS domain S-box-containing protein